MRCLASSGAGPAVVRSMVHLTHQRQNLSVSCLTQSGWLLSISLFIDLLTQQTVVGPQLCARLCARCWHYKGDSEVVLAFKEFAEVIDQWVRTICKQIFGTQRGQCCRGEGPAGQCPQLAGKASLVR